VPYLQFSDAYTERVRTIHKELQLYIECRSFQETDKDRGNLARANPGGLLHILYTFYFANRLFVFPVTLEAEFTSLVISSKVST
jgi:hypothetical protein